MDAAVKGKRRRVGVAVESFRGFRYPREVTSHCVWLKHRFTLSFRDIEQLMLTRGRHPHLRNDPAVVPEVRAGVRSRAAPGGSRVRVTSSYLDEVVVKINGRYRYRYWWRAVNQHGQVLDILLQNRSDAVAAKRFLRKTLTRYGKPRVLVTDKLRSYGVTHRQLPSAAEHRSSKYLNNRAENPHQPTYQREKLSFVGLFGGICSHSMAGSVRAVWRVPTPHLPSLQVRGTSAVQARTPDRVHPPMA